MRATVKEIWKNKTNNILPVNTNFNWWQEYENNTEVFDRAFAARFASFTYEPYLDDADNIGELMVAFSNDVKVVFYKNMKKYEELYRVHTIADADLPLSYNYDMKENMNKNTSNQNAMITGQRTDVDNLQVGSQKMADVNKVTAFNNNNENTNTSASSETGSRNDVRQFTKGQETDTSRGTGTEEYTLTRKGNIGVQTGADILRIFNDFWQSPRALFYNTVFDDIAMELLQIGG